jgi:hypothetical protein
MKSACGKSLEKIEKQRRHLRERQWWPSSLPFKIDLSAAADEIEFAQIGISVHLMGNFILRTGS